MDGGRGRHPFNGTRYEDVCEQLAACGMDMSGDEVMYDPAPAARWRSPSA
jgi:DNA-directed RNA polymerase beta subunit